MPQYNTHQYNARQYNQYSIYALLTDAVTLSDIEERLVDKVLTDTVTMVAALVFSFAKAPFAETMTLADALVKVVGVNKVDAITLVDLLNHYFSKSLSDSVTLSDATIKELSRALQDAIFVEEVSNPRASSKALSDTVVTDEWTSGKNIDPLEWHS